MGAERSLSALYFKIIHRVNRIKISTTLAILLRCHNAFCSFRGKTMAQTQGHRQYKGARSCRIGGLEWGVVRRLIKTPLDVIIGGADVVRSVARWRI